MKRNVLTVIISLLTFVSFAQQDTVRLRDIQKNTKSIVTDRSPQAVYFQLFGPGPIFSIMYDRRFGKTVNGLGFAAGIGFFAEGGTSIFSIPVSLNYLIGRSNSFVELSGGATYASASASVFSTNDASASLVFYHLGAGYRYQPTKGGFFFRGGVTTLFAQGGAVTLPYLGFGHNF